LEYFKNFQFNFRLKKTRGKKLAIDVNMKRNEWWWWMQLFCVFVSLEKQGPGFPK